MTAFLLRRLSQTVITLLVMSVLVFVGIYMVGNPIDILISASATPAERQQIITAMGLDLPVWQQYWIFLKNALAGDLGNSFVYNQPAIRLILSRMPATLELAFSAFVIALLIGIPLGLYAGLKPRAVGSRGVMVFSILGFSLPTFWIGLMMILVFSVYLGWLPASGRGQTVNVLGVPLSILTLDGLSHLVLPALNLALFKISLVIRLTRAGVIECMQMDYVRFARAKGVPEARIVLLHVLKNTLIPLITVIGLELGSLIAFAVVTETIFAWPGMGKLIIDAIGVLDRPLILAYLLMTVVMFTIINLIVDICYSLADPRVRLGEDSRS
ncbi:ABC transporter permease [Consotaella salsifontis]|uniref:Peptide/nickel transport system permease protein n=1 Tax=Consotaella salsifontis TaxID=1365950 RepID=A0A1T4SVL0_9HYPH|nr:ABC transporter permease [Consotaella salsifontis]SKA31948.1 peptide/nickel transport system permease protein [Consotaella salsifontis]